MSAKRNRTFEEVMKEGQSYLGQYLVEEGLAKGPDSKYVRCPNTEEHTHGDTTPSASLGGTRQKPVVTCHKCSWRGDIYDVFAIRNGHGKSSSGILPSMVKSVADRYNIDDSGVRYGPDEIDSHETFNATLLSIIADSLDRVTREKYWETFTAFARDRNISPDALLRYKVYTGSYNDIEQYLDGYSLRDVAIALNLVDDPDNFEERKVRYKLNNLFNSDSLIFTITNEHDRVKGFTRRYMKHGEKDANPYMKQKYYNSGFHKSKLMYLEDEASKYILKEKAIILVEGQMDALRLHSVGIKNAVAIMGVGLSDALISRIFDYYDVETIYIAFDKDVSGIKSTSKMIDQVLARQTKMVDLFVLTYEMEGVYDVDEFVKGMLEVNDIESIESLLFDEYFKHWIIWQAARYKFDGVDRKIHPEDMAAKLASFVGQYVMMESLKKNILDELSMIFDIPLVELKEHSEQSELDKKYDARSKLVDKINTLSRKRWDPDPDILINESASAAEDMLDIISQMNHTSSPRLVMKGSKIEFKDVISDIMSGASYDTFMTGFDLLDSRIGIPKVGKFIGIPGRENSGKSAFMRCLVARILHFNPEAKVMYYTLDDTLADTYHGLIAAWANTTENSEYIVPINDVKKFIHVTDQTKKRRIQSAIDDVSGWVDSGRLMMFGAASGSSLEYIYKMASTAKMQDPDGEHIIIVDNFFDMDGGENDDGIKKLLRSIKTKITDDLNIPIMCTMEMRKGNGRETSSKNRNVPALSDIRETGKIGYSLDLSLMLTNDLHIRPDKSRLVFQHGGFNRPVIELLVNKNKITDFKGQLMYKFYTNGSLLREVDFESSEGREFLSVIRNDKTRKSFSTLDPLYNKGKKHGSNPLDDGMVYVPESVVESEYGLDEGYKVANDAQKVIDGIDEEMSEKSKQYSDVGKNNVTDEFDHRGVIDDAVRKPYEENNESKEIVEI